MALISSSNLTSGNGGASGTSFPTASVSPASNALILASFTSRFSGGTVNTPTLTGASMTWIQVATIQDSGNHSQTTILRGLKVIPGSGALTVDFSGQTQEYCNWSIDQITGIDISGTNGSGAIVQSATGVNNGSTITAFSITLGSFSNANNATFGVVGSNKSTPLTAGSNFTELGANGANGAIESEFSSNNQTTVNWTLSSNNPILVGIAIELKAANPIGGSFLENFM